MKRQVVFVHGLWIHSMSWEPWQAHFGTEGYATLAPGWPGDGETPAATRSDPTGMIDVGVDRITDAYAEVIAGLGTPPIVVGHSFGGSSPRSCSNEARRRRPLRSLRRRSRASGRCR